MGKNCYLHGNSLHFLSKTKLRQPSTRLGETGDGKLEAHELSRPLLDTFHRSRYHLKAHIGAQRSDPIL